MLYVTQFLVTCVAAKSRLVSPALATIDNWLHHTIHCSWVKIFRPFVCFNIHLKQRVWAENSAGECEGGHSYLRIMRGTSLWLYTKRLPACSAFAAKLQLHLWGTVRMIGEKIIIRDESAGRDSAWMGCISRWSPFNFAGRMMTLWVDYSGALAVLQLRAQEWLQHTRTAKTGCIQQQYPSPQTLVHPSKRNQLHWCCSSVVS